MTSGRLAFIASMIVHAALLLVPLPRQSEPMTQHLLLVDLIAEAEGPTWAAPADVPGRPAAESWPADAEAAGETAASPRTTTIDPPVSEDRFHVGPGFLGDEGVEEEEEAEPVPEDVSSAAGERLLAREPAGSPEEPSPRPPPAWRNAPLPESGSPGLAEPGPVSSPMIGAAEPAHDPLPFIRERIVAAAGYPLLARKRGWEGTTRVRFLIDDAGFPSTLELVESSGHAVLDQACIRAVEEGAPYPGIEGWVLVPVVFRLEG